VCWLKPKRGRVAEPYSHEEYSESLAIPTPNQALHLTASSVRSYVAPASGSR